MTPTPSPAPRASRAVVGLVVAVWSVVAACARPGAPSGGPQDRRPPVLISVSPDTFARVEPGADEIRIRFDETVSERLTRGTMDDAVVVSPRTGAVEVDHSGEELTVHLEGGFRPGTVYRVTVLPVLTDRFNNALVAPFEWVFSTGPDFQATAVAGEVWDRLTGDPVEGVVVEALTPDSVPYVAVTDSAGIFALRYLPAGRYAVTAYGDRNQNDTPDAFEPQGAGDPLSLGVADTVFTSLAVMVPDTTPPQLVQGEKLDSVTLRLTFDDPLDPTQSVDGVVRTVARDSGTAPAPERTLHEWDYAAYRFVLDSAAFVRDSVSAAQAADSAEALAPQADSAAADSTPASRRGPAAVRPVRDTTPPPRLPNGERIPVRTLVVVLDGPIEGGDRYTVGFGPLRNVAGLVTEEGEGSIRLEPDPEPPADSLAVDSLAADSLAPDSVGAAPPDTGGVALRLERLLRRRSP